MIFPKACFAYTPRKGRRACVRSMVKRSKGGRGQETQEHRTRARAGQQPMCLPLQGACRDHFHGQDLGVAAPAGLEHSWRIPYRAIPRVGGPQYLVRGRSTRIRRPPKNFRNSFKLRVVPVPAELRRKLNFLPI